MRLLAYREDDRIRTGVLDCAGIRPVENPRGQGRLVQLAMNPSGVEIAGPARALRDVVTLPPSAPRALFAVDDNYRSQPRPRRAGLALQRPAALEPFLLGGPADDVLIIAIDPRSISAGGEPIVCPRGCERLDGGVTLALLIGEPGRGVRPSALPEVAGVTVAIDVVRRDVPQTQGYLARSGRSHTLIGPALVTLDELPSLSELRLWLTVDGERRQDGSTADMVATPEELVAVIGRRFPLQAGDVVLTGTPAGVALDRGSGWLQPGNVVVAEVEGVGRIESLVVAED